MNVGNQSTPGGIGSSDVGVPSVPVVSISSAPPSSKRKFAFWLLAGMISVVCVEVPAGSTMFPFFTLWGVLVVWPLYLLHSVFLAVVVFRFGKPNFWTLYAAGMLYGMYERYITKVVWVSFRAEGPIYRAAGIALPETLILVLFIHSLLAFVVPLLFTEMMLTNSNEVFLGFPKRVRDSIRSHPMTWAASLMLMFGLMQYVNSSSPLSSVISGAGNGVVIGLAVRWWRRSGGTAYSLRELLPGPKGLRNFGWVLLGWYVFWGIAINPKNIPPILHGQLTVWLIYAALFAIFYRCLLRSRDEAAVNESAVAFTWRGFVICVIVATVVTTAARAWLFPYIAFQVPFFFLLADMITGFGLLIGTIRYAVKKSPAPSIP